MNDVVQTTRRGYLTKLPAALHHDSVLLYIPRHVLIELERDLLEYARRTKHPVEPADAVKSWQSLYAPCIRVVDVPDSWGTDDPGVQALLARHSQDAPSARLAVALAECYVLSRDGDLTDNDFGRHEHLDLLLAAANEAEKNYLDHAVGVPVAITQAVVEAGIQGFRRLHPLVQVAGVIAAGVLVYYCQRDGRALRHLKRVGSVIGCPAQLFEKR